MAKPPSSAIGVDIGRHSMKAVLLQRRGANRFALSHFALRELSEPARTAEALAANLKALLHDLGGSARACGLAISSAEALIRIIDQPQTPPAILRDALRLNGMLLLNQDCKEMVLDCDEIPSTEPPQPGPNGVPQFRYVVAGIPRSQVADIHTVCSKTRTPETLLQVAPLALFNAFEFANEETFNDQAFALVDIGHRSSTVIVGIKRELMLVRAVDYGGHSLVEELICHGAASYEEIVQLLQQEEVLTVENARLSVTELVRSISSSIGFFEARRDAAIPRVYVSGGVAKSGTILKILTEELQLPCETWDPFAKCEISIAADRKPALTENLPVLGTACGAAAEILTGL